VLVCWLICVRGLWLTENGIEMPRHAPGALPHSP
jgi:hypothetical protein